MMNMGSMSYNRTASIRVTRSNQKLERDKYKKFKVFYIPSLFIANSTSSTEKFIVNKDAFFSSLIPSITSGSCQRRVLGQAKNRPMHTRAITSH